MANHSTHSSRRRLRLNKDEGWIFGICAGLADYLNTDAAIVRVGVIVAGLFLPKIVAAAYLIAWLVLDERTG